METCVGIIQDLLVKNEILGEQSLLENGFHFLKMKMENEDWYMIVNTGIEEEDAWVELNAPANTYVFLDPMKGKISKPEQRGREIRIQLEPERSLFVKCSNSRVNIDPFVYKEKSEQPVLVEGTWKIEFIKGGPSLPDDISTKKLQSWTEMGSDKTQTFSGTAKYVIDFDWGNETGEAELNLGSVMDCAQVKLNNVDCGILLGPTFKCRVENLQQGKNTLEVLVSNVAANRIRDLDIRGVDWKKFYDINFVNIEYEPFDASHWEIKLAGLLGPVSFTSLN